MSRRPSLHNSTTMLRRAYVVSGCSTLDRQAPNCEIVTDDAGLYAVLSAFSAQVPGEIVELTLGGPSDYQRVRRVWEMLPDGAAPDVHVRIENRADSALAGQWLIDLEHTPTLELQNRLAVFARYGDTAVLTSRAPLFWPEHLATLTLSANPATVLLREMGRVSITWNSRVVFLGRPKPDRIPRAFWKRLFAATLPEVLIFGEDGTLHPLRLFDGAVPKTLFVFPERMLPLERAYYLRAFDLVLGLTYGGQAPAILVLGPSNHDLKRIQLVLEIFSPSVTTKPLVRGRFPARHRLVRQIEYGLRRLAGLSPNAPHRYSERGMLFATPANANLLADVIDSLPGLKNVVYTGAWFGRAVRAVKPRRPELRWFCDTHDVFFMLDDTDAVEDRHFLYCAIWQRRLELEELSLADAVIAISPSDRDALVRAGLNRPLLVEPGSFSHVYSSTALAEQLDPATFGFVGSNNRNNQKCLALIHRVWWPMILKHWPNARLRLAGAVCRSNEAARLVDDYPDSVAALGFVDSIEDFYASTATMLSPIEVQGGLNFKSVEALMAGCFLFTNTLGNRCLGELTEGVSIVGADGTNLPAILDRLAATPDLAARRAGIRATAANYYGDEVAYTNLLAALTDPSSRVSKEKRY